MWLIAALALLAPPEAAQVTAEAGPPQASRGSFRLTWGAQYGVPVKASGSLTAFFGGSDDTGAVSGILLQLQGGQGGGKASLGYGFAWLDQGLPFPALGGAVRLALARTWGEPRQAQADSTFLGVEADLNFAGLKGTLGYLWRVAGEPQGSVVTWGLGVGF